MQTPSAFTIYNASAGSGKTFTLVKDYLKILFKSNSSLAFRSILALTFTNKAVNEMKVRIIDTLKEFSEDEILTTPSSMFLTIAEELEISHEHLNTRSKLILETIVHNYASFDISTIDKFNHKLIRTFAHDLNLPVNFEVELDTTYLLGKAVDKLIDKAGTDKQLTKVLVDFALEKADDDKSWDITLDFNNIAKLLINENEIPFIDTIKNKSLQDFSTLKSNLRKEIIKVEIEISEIAKTALQRITDAGLDFKDFSSSYVPKFFDNLANEKFNVSFTPKWQIDLVEGNSLYPKRVKPDIASTIDNLQPQLADAFKACKAKVSSLSFMRNCVKSVTPLSVLNAINQTLQIIKEEDNLLLISEFNSIITKEIKQQPAPFIYERIGEKFRHYFIDEFQDTSVLQWENLVPLIDNAISGQNLKGETGTSMLVGDPKQAIYRWRGGKAEQFIDLYAKRSQPFQAEMSPRTLPVNYRSFKNVVDFNNKFFTHLSTFAFSNPEHEEIYSHSAQEIFIKNEGYVELSFLDTKDEDKNELHCEKTLECIQKAQANGFSLGDICIIARKTKEGIAIAEYLSSQQIKIVSSESLMLKNSPEVNFISTILKLTIQKDNSDLKIELLSYLAEYALKLEDKHKFYAALVHLDTKNLFKELSTYGWNFNFNTFIQLPIYEAVETIVRAFNLNKTSNAYIQFYLDEVLDYSQKHHANISGFIDFWERKKDKLSVVSPQNNEAVQIMTIHKSKGLEFPVVIFPYANQNVYFDMQPKTWFPVTEENDVYHNFKFVYTSLNKDLEGYNELGEAVYTNHQGELELDSINLLYVVLTRAVEQLYVISEYDLDTKENEKLTLYSGLLINYLKSIDRWNTAEHEYSFGNTQRTSKEKPFEEAVVQEHFISNSREDHNLRIITNSGYLWDTEQEKAIEKGNLVHNIMAKIKTKVDSDKALSSFLDTGKISSTQLAELQPIIKNIISHKILSPYFEESLLIYNEKDIITKSGLILRPDRVVVNKNNEAVIIDYKTGSENIKHEQQLLDYQYILEEMDFKVTKKILVYINDGIEIKEF